MNNLVVTTEDAINRVIFALNDIGAIKTLERSLALMDKNGASKEENCMQTNASDDDDDLDIDVDAMSPDERARYEKILADQRKGMEDDLAKLKIEGSHADALQPIVILMGNSTLIKEKVIEPLKTRITDDEHYDWDLEFREISSSELTKEFVSSLPKPKGVDGGVLIISNFSVFTDSYSPDDQRILLINLMRKQGYTSYGIGPVCTGWRIIFIENTEDKNKWWPYSCVQYFGNKNCLYGYFVE